MVSERWARSADCGLSQLSGNLEKTISMGNLFCFLDWCNESIPGLANARPVLAASNQQCAQVNGIRGNLFAQFVLSAHKGAFFYSTKRRVACLVFFVLVICVVVDVRARNRWTNREAFEKHSAEFWLPASKSSQSDSKEISRRSGIASIHFIFINTINQQNTSNKIYIIWCNFFELMRAK